MRCDGRSSHRMHRYVDMRGSKVTARYRWALAVAVCLVAVLAVAGVLIAGSNPWHYVRLTPFGRPGVVVSVLVIAPLLVGFGSWLVLRNRSARWVAGGVAIVVALAMCATGSRFASGDATFGAEPAVTVVGVAPDGRFELVKRRYESFGGIADVVRIRSRDGMRSREAGQDLACFSRPSDAAAPDHAFGSARFVGDTEVEVTGADGVAWTTTFDQRTMLAEKTLSRGCPD